MVVFQGIDFIRRSHGRLPYFICKFQLLSLFSSWIWQFAISPKSRIAYCFVDHQYRQLYFFIFTIFIDQSICKIKIINHLIQQINHKEVKIVVILLKISNAPPMVWLFSFDFYRRFYCLIQIFDNVFAQTFECLFNAYIIQGRCLIEQRNSFTNCPFFSLLSINFAKMDQIGFIANDYLSKLGLVQKFLCSLLPCLQIFKCLSIGDVIHINNCKGIFEERWHKQFVVSTRADIPNHHFIHAIFILKRGPKFTISQLNPDCRIRVLSVGPSSKSGFYIRFADTRVAYDDDLNFKFSICFQAHHIIKLLTYYSNMTDNESFNFDHYELIPRQQAIRSPVIDQYAYFNSKPYTQLNKSQKTEDNKTQSEREDYERILNEKDRTIEELKRQIESLQKLLKMERQINRKNQIYFQKIKSFLQKPFLQNEQILEEIKCFADGKDAKSENFRQFQEKLRKRESQIRQLKGKLLQSTANNINSIFNSKVNEEQGIFKQIAELKEELNININPAQTSCQHDQKIKKLVTKYEQMLQLYHKNQKVMYELKNRQQQHFGYFSTLRVQLSNQMHDICNGYTNQKVIKLQNQIKNIMETIKNMPEKVKTQNSQDVKFKELVNEVQKLKERLTLRENEISKIRQENQQLLNKSKIQEKSQKQIKSLTELHDKLKEKDKRISQLQITIIEHIDSKIRSQSINSQEEDIQKLRNNLRNLKAVIINLKEQNKVSKQKIKQLLYANKELKKTLQNLSSSLQNSRIVERVSKDGASFKVVEDIIGVLINVADSEIKCKCLEKTADCLINLNDEYPELEDILEGLGVIQKTSNLLQMQD